MRDYNYRKHQADRVLKRRVINIPFAGAWYNYSHVYRRRYGIRLPEDDWFNYFGEYLYFQNTCDSINGINRERRWGYPWKEKYYTKRCRLKKVILKEINDEVRERYYISS